MVDETLRDIFRACYENVDPRTETQETKQTSNPPQSETTVLNVSFV